MTDTPELGHGGRTSRGTKHRLLRDLARRVKRLLVFVLAVYLSILVLLMIFEESLIFFPARYPAGNWQPTDLTFEDAWIDSSTSGASDGDSSQDATRIHGWYLPCDDPAATILYCHGNAGNLSHRADMLRVLQQHVRASVLIFDYRGYGRSQGKPNESGVLADARAARNWLAQRAGIEQSDVVLMGRSLGGAVAVDLAAESGARALIIESTFTSIPDMAAEIYPFLPARLLVRTQLDSLGKITSYHGPLLQSHGTADTIVPENLGKRLFDAANDPKQFVALEGLDHNDPQPGRYYRVLSEFLGSLPPLDR